MKTVLHLCHFSLRRRKRNTRSFAMIARGATLGLETPGSDRSCLARNRTGSGYLPVAL